VPGPRTAATGLVAVRSVLVGLVTIATTALAHAAAGGAIPGVPGLTVLVLATSATAWPVLRRVVRPAVLFGAVGLAQVLLHPAFQALAAPATDAAGHADGAGRLVAAGSAGLESHHPASWVMVLAHLAAGVGAVALVVAVDPVVRRLGAGRVRRRVAAPVIGHRIVPIGPPIPSMRPARVATDAPRRGPPWAGIRQHCPRDPPRAQVPPPFRSGVLL